MDKIFIAALVAAIMSLFLVSCEKSSYVGLEYSVPVQKTDTPKENTATNAVIVSGEFEKILPPEWGKIEGASISAVPADDEKGGCFDKKCLIVRTELGAVVVVFLREEILPEIADIVNYSFIKGNFDETYNSAVFAENSWIPAQAVDSKDRLEYLIEGVAKRNLRYCTLKKWDWQNKDDYFSTKVSGYEINVEDGILNVNYGGEQVLKIR
ncbi:MAG: hypothetical protein E7016_05930 [Alphaproteobacteria bacterium]|nr:hypothetical protein [Alphaproteobacteria bacterium]